MSAPKNDFAPWLGVFETVRVVEGVPLFLEEHVAEIRRAAGIVGLSFPETELSFPSGTGRWRWLITPSGVESLFTEEEPLRLTPLELSLSGVRVGSHNWDARFKTVSYLSHVQALQMAGTSEAVLLNEHGHVASAARANIFWRRGSKLFTPALETGCRQGVVRGFVLQQQTVEEVHFPAEALLVADEIFLTNSMRGIISVQAMEGRSLQDFTTVEKLRQNYGLHVDEQMKQHRESHLRHVQI